MRVLLPVLIALGCASERASDDGGGDDRCRPPDAAVVTCADASSGAGRCVGLPSDIWCRAPDGGTPSNPGGACPTPSDASYPLGCQVELPSANPYYPCGGQTCSCQNTHVWDDAGRLVYEPDGALRQAPGWLCPL
ncbi:MAG: hypothetical protein HYV09_08625 [Deltaproteobacteria bacterium]|nr:hypothetical protein [Deltaproteobacteria bacterium]